MPRSRIVVVQFDEGQTGLALILAKIEKPTVHLMDTQGETFTIELDRVTPASDTQIRRYWNERFDNATNSAVDSYLHVVRSKN